MPTYDYKCKKCEHEFELFQGMADKPIKKCPECNGEVERLIGTGGGLIFKGSGFYITDNRSESYKKGAKADKPKSEPKKSSTDSGKTDSKKKVTTGK